MKNLIPYIVLVLFFATPSFAEVYVDKQTDVGMGSKYTFRITDDTGERRFHSVNAGPKCLVTVNKSAGHDIQIIPRTSNSVSWTFERDNNPNTLTISTSGAYKFSPNSQGFTVASTAGTYPRTSVVTVDCRIGATGTGGGVLGTGDFDAMTAETAGADTGDTFWLTDQSTAGNCTTDDGPGAQEFMCTFNSAGAWVSNTAAVGGDNLGTHVATLDIDLATNDLDVSMGATGLVDGRDVSVDGTKLDLVEDEATKNGSILLEDTNADGNWSPELESILDTMVAQDANRTNTDQMVVQLPCDMVEMESTVVIGTLGDVGSNGIIVQGCGMGHAAGVNPRAGTEVRWDGAANATMFEIGPCGDSYNVPAETTGAQISGVSDGWCDDLVSTEAPRAKSITFRDFAVDCSGSVGAADHAFAFISSAQNVTFERVSFHDCDDSAIEIGYGTTSTTTPLQADTISFNDVYWDQVDTCIRNTALNAVGVNVNGGRCRYDDYGFDIVGGDINTTNHVMEGRGGSLAAFRFNNEFKPSTIVGTIVDSSGPGIITQGTGGTGQNLMIMGSRLSTSTSGGAGAATANGDIINYQLGGFLTVVGNKFAGTGGAQDVDIEFDNGTTSQDLHLYWANNFLATTVDYILVDYEDTADIVASGPGLTAADCSAPSPAFGTGTSGFVRGTICTEADGTQYRCAATDSMCLNNDWVLVTGGLLDEGSTTVYPTTTTHSLGVGWDGAGELNTDFGWFIDDATSAMTFNGSAPSINSSSALSLNQIAGNLTLDADTIASAEVVINSTSWDVTAAGAANFASIDQSAGTLELPQLADCSGVSALGEICVETADSGVFVGDGAAPPVEIGAGSGVQLGDDPLWTGAHDFGGATSVELPNNATPIVDALGEFAFDTTVADWQGGLKIYDGAAVRRVITIPEADLTTPTDDFILKYNAVNDDWEFEADSGAGGGEPTTYEQLSTNLDIGFGAAQVPQGSLTAPLASPTFTGTVTIPSDQITLDNLVDATTTDLFLARDTAGGGTWEEVSAAAAASMLLLQNIGGAVTDAQVPNTITVDDATVAATSTVVTTTDTTSSVLLAGAGTGDQAILSDPGITYDATANDLTVVGDVTAASFSTGGAVTASVDFDDSDDTGTVDASIDVNCPTADDCDMAFLVDSGSDTEVEAFRIDTTATGVTSIVSSVPIYIAEQADAGADVAGFGQIWINTATPNELWWTNDAGTDVQLGTGGSSAFSAITTSTNTTATMTVGTGASILASGTGSITATDLGADGLDAISEIAAGIKRGPDATDTHILTTDVSAPGALTCLNMDTDGSVVLAAGACGVAGGEANTLASPDVGAEVDLINSVSKTGVALNLVSLEADDFSVDAGNIVTIDTGLTSGIQAYDAELDTIAGLTETNGNVMFVAGGAWTSDPTPQIDGSDFVADSIPSSSLDTEIRSMYWGAGAMSADGTNCADPAEVTIGTWGKQYSVICTDSDSSTITGTTHMPDGWNAGTVTFALSYIQDAVDISALNADVAARCVGTGETPLAYGTEVAIDDAAVTGSDAIDVTTSAAVTAAGTCAAGDALQWQIQLDATGTTTDVTTLNLIGVKMEYTSTVGD